MNFIRLCLCVVAAVVIAGCSGQLLGDEADAAVAGDGGASPTDSGTGTPSDAGTTSDGGATSDAGATSQNDAGAPPFDGGIVALPDAGPRLRSWATALPTDQWVALPGTAFMPWARSDAGIPKGDYRGTNPLGSMVNAFSDPAHDGRDGVYFYGGGHGDGTCNAVARFNLGTLTYELVGQPTPPSVYLPKYLVDLNVTYPSGLPFGSWFLTQNELTDSSDWPYAAPALARVSTHMYGAAAMRGATVHYFYLTYGEFNSTNGTWSGRGVDLGAQLIDFRPQYGTVPLQQGTVATYDEVTDRFFVTLNPGDSGGGWRTGFVEYNPNTRRIDHVYEVGSAMNGPMPNSANVVKVGRQLFVFGKKGNWGEPTVMHQGFIFNLDTHDYQRFELEPGTEAESTFPFSSTQETIPSFYDGVAIRRWNFALATRNKILSVSPVPLRGTGSETDPLIFSQTVRTVGGTIGTGDEYDVLFVYKRLVYDAPSRCAVVIPNAESDWYALCLSP